MSCQKYICLCLLVISLLAPIYQPTNTDVGLSVDPSEVEPDIGLPIIDREGSYSSYQSPVLSNDVTSVSDHVDGSVVLSPSNTLFQVTHNISTSFVRSGLIIPLVFDPAPDSLLANWDLSANSSFVPPVPSLQPGNLTEEHTLYLYPHSGENSEEWVFQFTVDNTAVEVTKLSPSRTKVDGSDPVLLNITPSNYTGRTWAWNEMDHVAASTILFPKYQNGSVIEGPQALNIRVVDAAFRVSEHVFHFFVDRTPPPLTLLNHVNGSTLPSGTELLFENNTPVLETDDRPSFSFSWNNGPIFSDSMPVLPSPNGQYHLEANVTDEVGNMQSKSYLFNSTIAVTDITPSVAGRPNQSVIVSFSEPHTFVNYTYVYMNGTVSSYIGGNETTFVNGTTSIANGSIILVEGQAVTFVNGSTSIANNTIIYLDPSPTEVPSQVVLTNLTDPGRLPNSNIDDLSFIVNAYDSGGHWFNQTYSIRVDGYPIALSASDPANHTTFPQGTAVAVAVSFNESAAYQIYQWNHSLTNFTSTPILPMDTGIYELTVWFADLAQNWRSATIVLSRSLALTWDVANNSLILPNSTIPLTSSAPPDQLLVQWDDGPIQSLSPSLVLAPTSSGHHSLQIWAHSNGTVVSDRYLFLVSLHATLSPADRPYQSGTPINVTFDFEQPNFWYYVFEVVNDKDNYQFDQSPTIPSGDGNHTLYVKASNDHLVIDFVTSQTYTTDDTPPTFSLSNTQNNSVIAGGFNVSFSHSPDVAQLLFRWNDGPTTTSTPSLSPSTSGDHWLYVNLTDKAGNLNSYTFLFEVDALGPQFSADPASGSVISPTTIIRLNFSEPVNFDRSYILKDDLKVWITKPEPTITDFGYANRTVIVILSLTDYIGNHQNHTLTYELVNPQLTYQFLPPDLIIRSSDPFQVNLSKKVFTISYQWYHLDNNSLIKSGVYPNPYINNRVLLFSFYTPEGDGHYRLEIRFMTYALINHTESLTIQKDTQRPVVDFLVPIVTNHSTGNVTNYHYYQNSTLHNVSRLAPLSLTIHDLTYSSATLSLHYSNGTSTTHDLTSSTISFQAPDVGSNLTILLVVEDEAGWVTALKWTVLIAQPPPAPDHFPEVPGFGLLTVGVGLAGVAYLGRMMRHKEE